MGCSTSLNSEVKINVVLSPSTIFKVDSLTEKTMIRTSLKDFCKKVISSNINPSFIRRSIHFSIFCRDKEYSMKDHVNLYDLRLCSEDSIRITAVLLDEQTFMICLRIYSGNIREERKEVTRLSLISSIVPKQDLKVLLGHLELETDQTFEDYDIVSDTRLLLVENYSEIADLQAWKIKKSGLILEALCLNLNCEAYKQRISICLGLGEFNIASETSSDNSRLCDCCNSVLGNICKVSFVHCVVNYTIKTEDGDYKEVLFKVKNCIEDNCNIWRSNIKVARFS